MGSDIIFDKKERSMTKGTTDRQTRSKTVREKKEKEEKSIGSDTRTVRESSRSKQSSLHEKMEGKFDEKIDKVIASMKGERIAEAL